MYRSIKIFTLVFVFTATGDAFGGIISVSGDVGDGIIDVNGLPQNISDQQLRVGLGGDNVRGQADIFFFELPTLGSNVSLTGASLNIQYLGVSTGSPGIWFTPNFNADLFGIGARTTTTILSSDYYDGNATLSTDTLISKGFITPATAPGNLQASGSTLLTFLTSLYQPNGTPIAEYAVFRVNADIHLPVFSYPYRGYELASADNPNPALVPELQLTVAVPEPTTAMLAITGSLVLAVVGWRRRELRLSKSTDQ